MKVEPGDLVVDENDDELRLVLKVGGGDNCYNVTLEFLGTRSDFAAWECVDCEWPDNWKVIGNLKDIDWNQIRSALS